MSFTPSPYQQRIFEWVQNGSGSAVIQAVAGSGKTTTIVKATELLPADRSALFLAFNKSIATELTRRLPPRVQASTFHSAGFRALSEAFVGRIAVEPKKTRNIADKVLVGPQAYLYGQGVVKLVGLAKGVGIVPQESRDVVPVTLVEDRDDVWLDLIDRHDIQFGNPEFGVSEDTRMNGVRLARRVLAESIIASAEQIDYDDMLYLPAVLRLGMARHDWLFVDEAQDTNAIQRELLRRMLAPGGRLVAVGDTHQAIYGFRGADSAAMATITAMFECVELPLTISYRCPQAVVKFARNWVQHIEAAPTAAEGVVQQLTHWSAATFRPTDAVLCRSTAPLVELAYYLIRAGVGCRIMGREIGKGLVTLVNRFKARGVEALLEKLKSYQARESARLSLVGKDEQIAALKDKVECIELFVESLPPDARTIPSLVRRIESVFDDESRGELLTLATVHKAKGLEWPRVFLLDRTKRMPSKWAQQPWQKEQERNLIYVAVTRAQEALIEIDRDGRDECAT